VNWLDLRINRVCGSGDINTSLCVGVNTHWPINDIYVIGKNTPYSKEFEAVELADQTKIIFTRIGNFLPVVRFKLTEGHVWFNANGYQTSKGRELYPLVDYGKCDKYVRTRSVDPRFKLIGEVREDKLFKDNEIYDVVASLPNYPIDDTTKYNWNLYANNYYYWSHYWDGSSVTSRQEFFDTLERILDVKDMNNYILETSIFYALAICIVLQYFFGYFTLSVFWKRDDINKPMRTLFHIFGFPIKMIALGFLVYFCYRWITTISKYQDLVISITVSEWAPDFTTQAFFAYEEALQSVYHITYRVVILACLSVMLTLFDLAWELSIRGILQSTYGKLYEEYIT
jgi:hypothetical protein